MMNDPAFKKQSWMMMTWWRTHLNDRHAALPRRTRSTCLTLIAPTLFGAKHPEIWGGSLWRGWYYGKHPKAIQNISLHLCWKLSSRKQIIHKYVWLTNDLLVSRLNLNGTGKFLEKRRPDDHHRIAPIERSKLIGLMLAVAPVEIYLKLWNSWKIYHIDWLGFLNRQQKVPFGTPAE